MKRDDLISHLQVMHTWGKFHSERGIPLEPKCCEKMAEWTAEILKYLEQQEGEWIEVGYGKPDAWDCSICGATVGRKCAYCPGCGAKMRNGSRRYKAVIPK